MVERWCKWMVWLMEERGREEKRAAERTEGKPSRKGEGITGKCEFNMSECV